MDQPTHAFRIFRLAGILVYLICTLWGCFASGISHLMGGSHFLVFADGFASTPTHDTSRQRCIVAMCVILVNICTSGCPVQPRLPSKNCDHLSFQPHFILGHRCYHSATLTRLLQRRNSQGKLRMAWRFQRIILCPQHGLFHQPFWLLAIAIPSNSSAFNKGHPSLGSFGSLSTFNAPW